MQNKVYLLLVRAVQRPLLPPATQGRVSQSGPALQHPTVLSQERNLSQRGDVRSRRCSQSSECCGMTPRSTVWLREYSRLELGLSLSEHAGSPAVFPRCWGEWGFREARCPRAVPVGLDLLLVAKHVFPWLCWGVSPGLRVQAGSLPAPSRNGKALAREGKGQVSGKAREAA